jgi:uncharacterized protein YgbK (DUF1537 family)
LLADDLTGACDATVPFKLRGARSVVCLGSVPSACNYDVVGLSTESRDLEPTAAQQRVREAASELASLDPAIIFKKIDSTLRGNVGAEIAAALDAFDSEFALVTPAFPRMGRMVRDGRLCVEQDAAWQPIDIAERLRAQGLDSRFLLLETACDGDLEAAVAETFHSGRRVLYAGSAGLANAVAKIALGGAEISISHQPSRLPCIFCIGSDHPVTRAQLSALASERSIECFATKARSLTSCLEAGRHAILFLPRNETPYCAIRDLLEPAQKLASALLLSGGDTASLVCAALGAEAIELEGEIVTGLPWGRLQGGSLPGFAVATKSGGFGAPDALIEVADYFTCHTN